MDGSFRLEELTSKNIIKYEKIITLITEYKGEYLQLKEYGKNEILDYIISKFDKRCKFNLVFTWDESFLLILKLYRDIDFRGASALEIKSIKQEFNSYRDIEKVLEEMKNNGMLEIESRGDLYQIRFKA